MIIKNALQKIEEIVRGLKNQAIGDRLISYSTIVTITGRIDDVVKDQKFPNYIIYKQDLLKGCEVLCGLEDNNGVDDAQYIGGALAAVRKMGSYSCFNVDNHYI